MRTPQTYKQWVSQAGKEAQMVVQAIMSDNALKKMRQSKVKEVLVSMITHAFAEGFNNLGMRPSSPVKIARERDEGLRGDEYIALMQAIQGDLPLEYLSLAYHTWQDGYKEVKHWEEMSLSEYLQEWLWREEGEAEIRDKVITLLDNIDPKWRE